MFFSVSALTLLFRFISVYKILLLYFLKKCIFCLQFFSQTLNEIHQLKMAKLVYLAIVPIIYMAATRFLHLSYFSGTFCDSKASLKGKTVVVTGANTGIGKATAMDMAARGARVIMACRSEKRTLPAVEEIIAKTGNKNIVFMQLDLASFASVNRFSKAFLATENRLDILINNAGMVGKERVKLNENGIEMTLAINHLGPFLLTQNLLELLVKSGPGSRIINVSSSGHHFANPQAFEDLDGNLAVDGALGVSEEFFLQLGPAREPNYFLDNFMPAFVHKAFIGFMMRPEIVRYANSKLANVLFTKELAKRLEGTGVSCYSLHPGVIKTDIGVDRNTGQDLNKDAGFFVKVLNFLNPFAFMLKTLEEGAQTTICCAVSERFASESGKYYSDCAATPVRRSEFNDEFAAKFYDWSSNVVQNAILSNGVNGS